MNGVNRWTGIGNLTRDPEIRATARGESVTNITIACNESYKDASGQKVERAEFVQIVFFGRLAEIAGQYLQKGALVYVEGSIRTEKYQAKDGSDRYSTKIMGRNLQMLGGKGQGGERQQAPRQSAQPERDEFNQFDDEIPF